MKRGRNQGFIYLESRTAGFILQFLQKSLYDNESVKGIRKDTICTGLLDYYSLIKIGHLEGQASFF